MWVCVLTRLREILRRERRAELQILTIRAVSIATQGRTDKQRPLDSKTVSEGERKRWGKKSKRETQRSGRKNNEGDRDGRMTLISGLKLKQWAALLRTHTHKQETCSFLIMCFIHFFDCSFLFALLPSLQIFFQSQLFDTPKLFLPLSLSLHFPLLIFPTPSASFKKRLMPLMDVLHLRHISYNFLKTYGSIIVGDKFPQASDRQERIHSDLSNFASNSWHNFCAYRASLCSDVGVFQPDRCFNLWELQLWILSGYRKTHRPICISHLWVWLAVEFSSLLYWDLVHVLGYGINTDSPALFFIHIFLCLGSFLSIPSITYQKFSHLIHFLFNFSLFVTCIHIVVRRQEVIWARMSSRWATRLNMSKHVFSQLGQSYLFQNIIQCLCKYHSDKNLP